MEYKDKHGNPIEPGMVITNNAGLTKTVEDLGDGTLGISAVNEDYRRNHPWSTENEYYPLTPVATKHEWEVIK